MVPCRQMLVILEDLLTQFVYQLVKAEVYLKKRETVSQRERKWRGRGWEQREEEEGDDGRGWTGGRGWMENGEAAERDGREGRKEEGRREKGREGCTSASTSS